jgi:N-formylglutamate amidohydrolase
MTGSSHADPGCVLITVSHAGRAEPADMAAMLRVPPDRLLPLEDRYVDRLTVAAEEAGVPVIRADRPRAWIDLNRREDELDPAMVAGGWPDGPLNATAKMLGGLGLIPRRLAGIGDIWRAPLPADHVRRRIREDYRPFHDAVAATLRAMRDRHGRAVLIDLHSMPASLPQMVVGDLFGRSAPRMLVDRVLACGRDHGLTVARNKPYAGGHIVERHGDPRQGVAAVQVELSRRLYLQPDLSTPDEAGVAAMARLVADLAALAAEDADHAVAAE